LACFQLKLVGEALPEMASKRTARAVHFTVHCGSQDVLERVADSIEARWVKNKEPA
jgi:hypothetical protein